MTSQPSRRRFTHTRTVATLLLGTLTACVAAEEPVRIPPPAHDPAPASPGAQKAVFAGGCF
jgi:hypothetical protein